MVYLNNIGIINALGCGKSEVYAHLTELNSPGMSQIKSPVYQRDFFAGTVLDELPVICDNLAQFNCRNNRLILAALEQVKPDVDLAKANYGADRIGIVLGTSTSGIGEAELAMKEKQQSGKFPSQFAYKQQEIGSIAEFVSSFLEVTGPAYTISTACSSSGKVFASARELLELDICDLVIVGGADSLCELTLSGFASLEATSDKLTNPFSVNRQGINVGEGAAVFIMSKQKSDIALLGVGESSDAHHMSAPEPNGKGAKAAIEAALKDACLAAKDIDYINLHGTATQLNDAMESHAVYSLFKDEVPCSSTKPLTGHTLGAAGATEAAICWLLLKNAERKLLVEHQFDGELDQSLDKIQLISCGKVNSPIKTAMSNSFAFGGNNVSVILGREAEVNCGK